MSPFKKDFIHGSVQLSWCGKHFPYALPRRAFRNKQGSGGKKRVVEKNSAHICEGIVLCFLQNTNWKKPRLPTPGLGRQSLPWSLHCKRPTSGGAAQCGGPGSRGDAVLAGVRPPPPGHCHREVRDGVERAGTDCCRHMTEGGPGAQAAEGLNRWEQDPTTRPMEEEVGRSQKGEGKERCLFCVCI